MKLLTAEQIRKLDQATIEKEPIASIDLMERAASRCADWFSLRYPRRKFAIICGTGNNGGDGLAIARMLHRRDCDVEAYILGNPQEGSPDFLENHERLEEIEEVKIYTLDEESHLLSIDHQRIIIDAIFGTGLTRPVEGWRADVFELINEIPNPVIAIDIPSGLFAEQWEASSNVIIRAQHTLSFQMPKLSFLFAENFTHTGEVHILNIGLDRESRKNFDSPFHLTATSDARTLIQYRKAFEHKGSRGMAQLFGGSQGTMGAALLMTRAALRSGCGLVVAHIPAMGLDILQTGAPAAMASVDSNRSHVTEFPVHEKTTAIAIGPGLGKDDDTANALLEFIESNELPIVLDADALNILSEHGGGLLKLKPNTILTPHAREFDRLFGEHGSSFDRFRTLQLKAQELDLIIVLKGAYTRVALPDGTVHFNESGNPGMAKGGSGDVLTGLICGLLAQGYSTHVAARMGVFIHGLSGDKAASYLSKNAMNAEDLIDFLPNAWREVE